MSEYVPVTIVEGDQQGSVRQRPALLERGPHLGHGYRTKPPRQELDVRREIVDADRGIEVRILPAQSLRDHAMVANHRELLGVELMDQKVDSGKLNCAKY